MTFEFGSYLCLIREQNRAVWFCDGGGKLVEDDRLLWNRHVLLSTMVNVVQTDTDQLLGVVDGGLEFKGPRLEGVVSRSSLCYPAQ